MRISDWSSDVCSSDLVHWAVLPQEMESIRRKHHGRVRSAITQKASRVRKGRKRRKGEANADNFSDRPSRRHPSESWGPCCCLQWIPAFAGMTKTDLFRVSLMMPLRLHSFRFRLRPLRPLRTFVSQREIGSASCGEIVCKYG